MGLGLGANPRAFRSQALRNWRVAPPRRSVRCKELSAAEFFSTLCKHFIYKVESKMLFNVIYCY